ncbi:MAG: hypothetical protein Q7T82_11250 [Armatimonadota bacterium]|nr:hypothetical protein [Armatimonadota bacterium]
MSYMALAVIFFLANGLTNTGLKVANGLRGPAAVPMTLLWMYLVASLFVAPGAIGRKRPVRFRNLWVGALGGVGTAVGSAAIATIVGRIPGYVVFPVAGGGTLLLVALAARVFFREKMSAYGVAGIAVGAAAIVLLNL